MKIEAKARLIAAPVSSEQVFNQLIKALGADNGVAFQVAQKHKVKAIKALDKMLASGCRFTRADIEDIAGGDQDEAAEKFGKFKGYKELDTVLNLIFEAGAD